MNDLLERLGISGLEQGARIGVTPLDCRGEVIESISPVDGKPLGRVRQADAAAYDRVVRSAEEAFLLWREVPAPRRGEVVRRIGEAFRERKKELGALIAIETGKYWPKGKAKSRS